MIRNVTFVLALALMGSAFAPSVANAADEEKRRVLRARDVETEDPASEYARMAEQKRMESIRRLKELLGKGVEGETKAEMMLRLSDLYFQQGRHLYLSEMAAFDKEYEACFNNEACKPDTLKPDNSGSRDWQNKSVKLYKLILKNYPRYQRADQATFFLGAALQDMGQRDEAVETFKKLVKLYPQSAYIADTYVLIGEYYFDNDNAYGALRAYLKATQYKDSDKYPFAMYKLGWCYYNVGDYGKAIDTMKAVVSYSMSQGANEGSNLQLQEEALKDLVRFFADAGEMDEAYEYFNKLGKKELIRSMLKRLATMYFEQGKFDESVETYRRLINENPQSSDNPEYQHEIIQAYRKTGQREKTLDEINRMRKDYGKDSAWARANASNKDAIAESGRRIEENLRRVAVEYHNQGRKLEKARHRTAPEVYALARQAYATYLEEFPSGPHAYEVRYAYGELLYKVKDYPGAFTQYMMVVDIDPKGKHSKFCAESAIFAADEMVKKEGGGKAITAKPGDKKEPQELTDWEQKLVMACAKYVDLYPEDKKNRNIIYKSAYLLYNKYRFEEAAEQFNKVIALDPGSKEAIQAANLMLDSFVINEEWEALKKNSKFYYDQKGLGNKAFKDDVYKIYQNASFKLIEVDFEKDKDKKKAADRFVAFYEEFAETDNKNLALALNNASIYYYDAKQVEPAMKVRHILVEDPKFGPKTKYYYDQIAALGYDYETVADFEKAAFYYEKLFVLYPEEREKRVKDKVDDETLAKMDGKAGDAIYSAAVFRAALDDTDTAIENYSKFIKQFPDDERVMDVRLTIGRIYEDREDWTKAASVFYDFYTKDHKDASDEITYFARLHYGRALEAQGQTKKAMALYTKTAEEYKKKMEAGGQKGAHTEFVAEMMYKTALPQYEAYKALELKGCGCKSKKREDKALTDSLSKKSKSLVEVEKTFGGIINTGAGEWGLAGLLTLGQAYENMGDTLKNGDTPYYLTDDQLEIYSMRIEDKVYTQTEKAVAAYKLALDKSYELTLYNENTAYATRRLGELRPDDFPGLEEKLIDGRYTSQEAGKNFEFESEL